MPLTAKGEKIEGAMKEEYGAKEGEGVFYASRNSGRISGVDSTSSEMIEFVKKCKADGMTTSKTRAALEKKFPGKPAQDYESSFRKDSATKSLDELIAGASAVADRVKAAADGIFDRTSPQAFGKLANAARANKANAERGATYTIWGLTKAGKINTASRVGGSFTAEEAAAKILQLEQMNPGKKFTTDSDSPTHMGSVDKVMRGDGDQRATLINTALEMEERASKHRGMTGGSTSSEHGVAYKDLMAAARFFRRAADDASWLKEAERAKTLADKTSVRAMTDEPNGGAKKTPQIVPGRSDASPPRWPTQWSDAEVKAMYKGGKARLPKGINWSDVEHEYEKREREMARMESDTLAYGVSGKSRVPMAVDNVMVRDRIDRLAQGVHSLLKRGESVSKIERMDAKGAYSDINMNHDEVRKFNEARQRIIDLDKEYAQKQAAYYSGSMKSPAWITFRDKYKVEQEKFQAISKAFIAWRSKEYGDR